ncbi:hypothetical protein B9Z55_001474 [Caenorhabditis nigoni]|uniref:Uncharacterized protein n=1 Tax=Caenorhabditis nigoni TaxID=1611254 RepID=A0A2G5VFV1_9PELO|nr:hypothetical protein B9Z55_001474 [Caenorhabditis nigoni]
MQPALIENARLRGGYEGSQLNFSDIEIQKELDKYEKSVEDHVKKVGLQLDQEWANINKKYKEKLELMKKLEVENKKMSEENERMRQKMEAKKKVKQSIKKSLFHSYKNGSH